MEAYIFDLDGTLINSFRDLCYSINTMLISYSFPIFTIDEVMEMVGKGARNLVTRALPEDKRGDEEFVSEALLKYQRIYDEHCLDKVCLYDGLYPVLTRLHDEGKRLAIVTNKDAGHARAIVEKLVPGIFDEVIGYGSGFLHKPSPDAVNCLLEKFGVSRDKTVFVGDMAVDAMCAQNAGVRCALVTWGPLGEKVSDITPSPDFVISSADELLTI